MKLKPGDRLEVVKSLPPKLILGQIYTFDGLSLMNNGYLFLKEFPRLLDGGRQIFHQKDFKLAHITEFNNELEKIINEI